ncbi:MAG: DUF3341 domain-containing protein [Thermoanaerobaculia bacterium]|nr:DUF3341 domain-containing protein [Thermoanaerobaculia bacterium]
MSESRTLPIYGLIAEFGSRRQLIDAVERTRAAGYTRMEAYTPYPIEELNEALGHHRSRLPLIVLLGGILGAVAGFGLQYWVSVIEYPLNVGGRPLNSWVSFVPVTFETTVLVAAFAAVLGMLALNRLPMPYHPVFGVKRFKLASRDRYFLALDARDPLFDEEQTRLFLDSLGPTEVNRLDP